jgi:phosphoglycerate kinase
VPNQVTLEELDPEDLKGRAVLVRVDFNVPLDEFGGVAADTRLRGALPTLKHLRDAGARSILVSHLGRPDGGPDPRFSLRPVAERLSGLLGSPVAFRDEAFGSEELRQAIGELPEGGFILLENIRFHPGETRNDPDLARDLANLADLYVGDAFGTAHRAHASTVGAPQRIREKGGKAVAGLLMARELRFLGDTLDAPERPFVVVMGGAKISGKIDLIEAILERADRLLVGGAMANTFFRALGLETGASLVEIERVEVAGEILERAGDRLILPVDCIVADRIEDDAETREVDRTEIGPGDRVGDIGPRTREIFAREIDGAATVIWNGPMGVFELAPFEGGTGHVARAMAHAADRGAIVVVGGGDSAAAAEHAGVADRLTHISTGGGASLDLMSGNELPGVTVLNRNGEGR